MSNAITPSVNLQRDRDQRLQPIEAARQAPNYQQRSAQTSATGGDATGYWDDRDGTWKNYFRLDVSLLDGPDVLA